MTTVFSRIIAGELPARFVWTDDHAVAFLSVNPLGPGHTLVVPRAEVDHWVDAPPELLGHLTAVAQAVGVAVREVWPERLPLWLRISATDWADGGWDIEQSVELARIVKDLGVDLIDVSSGGLVPHARIPVEPGYQVPFSARIRREAGIATGAVGLITRAAQAEKIVADEEADVVLLARELLRDPYFPLRAAHELGANVHVPEQYQRAW